MIKTDRMCVDKDLLKKTRRQFYPKKPDPLRHTDRQYMNHNYLVDMQNENMDTSKMKTLYHSVNKVLRHTSRDTAPPENASFQNFKIKTLRTESSDKNTLSLQKHPKFFAQITLNSTQRQQGMQDLLHITGPKSKKPLDTSNYTYLKRAQKIDINNLQIEEGDSFYKTTFPIEKINEFLYQLGGNFTRQN